MIPLSLFGILILSSCKTSQPFQRHDDGKIQVAILQLNDVYEIGGVDRGRAGDLSRVAHYYKNVQKQYPQSMMVMAGDFLNPSLIGTMRYDG